MRFPFGLSANLLKVRVSSFFGAASAGAPIFRLNPCVTHFASRQRFDESSTELEWHSSEECAARVRAISSPVVWLGGTEPLLHPEIGKAANAVVEIGRFAFVHTSGYNLRQRIHEFRPDSRLFLTLEFAGREEIHNRVEGIANAFERSMEAIHAAKLSGFLVAAHVTVTTETDPCDVGELIEFLDKKDIDGFLASAGGNPDATMSSALQKKLKETRELIRFGRWERLSALLDASCAEPAPVPARLDSSGENAFEEGD
jgi:MoaA/NifB/PqqE/SkfB family radical SAM enzyme